jgi:hypothetical protein
MLAGVIAAQFLAVAAVVMAVVVLVRTTVEDAGLAVTAAALVVTWSARKLLTGVYVGEAGIQIRRTGETQTFAWSDIAAIEVRISSHARELGGPWSSLWMVTATGTPIETSVIRGSYWAAPQTDLVGRRLPPVGLYLIEHIFDSVVARLKTEHANRIAASAGPNP